LVPDLCLPEDVQTVGNTFPRARAGKAATVELRLKTKKGSYVWCELRCRTVSGEIVAGHARYLTPQSS
jgi:hypothetical protein